MVRFLTAQRVRIVKTFYEKEKCIWRSLCKIRCNEVVGISNSANVGKLILLDLTVTLSCTRASCPLVQQKRFRPGDFTVKIEPVVLNFVISLCTVDPHGALFLPKIVWSFCTVCVAHSSFL